ncbi:MAG TPA: hypothetical protein PKW80_00665 [Bacteroidales bacterium]|nr:hypothetical protein [Bacteroidales bacterium]
MTKLKFFLILLFVILLYDSCGNYRPQKQPARINLISPAIDGNVKWSDPNIQDWINTAKVTEDAQTNCYEIAGKVDQSLAGAEITLDIQTFRWKPQGSYIVDAEGNWKGNICLDDSLPPMTLSITLFDGNQCDTRKYIIE